MPPEGGVPEALLPRAELAHFCKGRARLVFRQHKNDPAFFEDISAGLNSIDSVASVIARPTTGSVIVSFDGAPDKLLGQVSAAGLFELAFPAPVRSLTEAVRGEADKVNFALKMGSRGGFDIASAGFLLIVGVGLVQLARGNIGISALTAFWYAANILLQSKSDQNQSEG